MFDAGGKDGLDCGNGASDCLLLRTDVSEICEYDEDRTMSIVRHAERGQGRVEVPFRF